MGLDGIAQNGIGLVSIGQDMGSSSVAWDRKRKKGEERMGWARMR